MRNDDRRKTLRIYKVLPYIIYYITLQPLIIKYIFMNVSIFSYAPEVVIYVLFMVKLIRLVVNKKKIQLISADKILVILFIYIFISTIIFNGFSLLVALLSIRQLFRYVFLYFIIINSETKLEDINNILKHIKIVVFIESVFGTLQLIFPTIMNHILAQTIKIGDIVRTNDVILNGKAIFSLFERYDRYAIFLCLMILILLYQPIKTNKDYILLMFTISNLIFTYSRASWIALLVVILINFIILKRNIKLYFITFAIAGFALISSLININFASNNIYFGTPIERLLQIFNPEFMQTNMDSARLKVVLEIVPSFFENINSYVFTGVGLGSFTELANNFDPELYNRFFYIFNVYSDEIYHISDVYWIELLIETGLIGMLMIVLCFFKLSIYFYKEYRTSEDILRKRMNLISLSFVFSCIVSNMFAPNLISTSFAFYFWMVIGITKSYDVCSS